MKLNKEMSEALRRYINGQNGVVCDTVEEFDDYLETCRSLGFKIGFPQQAWRNPGMCIRLGNTNNNEIHTGLNFYGREYTINFKEIPSFFVENGWIDGGELDVGSMPDPLFPEIIINDRIEADKMNDVRQAKIESFTRTLSKCGVEIDEIRQTEIITKPISYQKLKECVIELMSAGIPYDDLFRLDPMSGNMCEFKLGMNL